MERGTASRLHSSAMRDETPDPGGRFDRAIAAIDAANGRDPNRIVLGGEEQPKEQAHARRVTEWVRRLRPEASEALLLAARAHHVRRWELPRSGYPADRPGYLRWRAELQAHHAKIAGEILRESGYDEATIARVGEILHKRNLARDEEVQTFEDALCLTFMETQLADFAAAHPDAKARAVLRKTLRKMSPAGRREAERLALPAGASALVQSELPSD